MREVKSLNKKWLFIIPLLFAFFAAFVGGSVALRFAQSLSASAEQTGTEGEESSTENGEVTDSSTEDEITENESTGDSTTETEGEVVETPDESQTEPSDNVTSDEDTGEPENEFTWNFLYETTTLVINSEVKTEQVLSGTETDEEGNETDSYTEQVSYIYSTNVLLDYVIMNATNNTSFFGFKFILIGSNINGEEVTKEYYKAFFTDQITDGYSFTPSFTLSEELTNLRIQIEYCIEGCELLLGEDSQSVITETEEQISFILELNVDEFYKGDYSSEKYGNTASAWEEYGGTYYAVKVKGAYAKYTVKIGEYGGQFIIKWKDGDYYGDVSASSSSDTVVTGSRSNGWGSGQRPGVTAYALGYYAYATSYWSGNTYYYYCKRVKYSIYVRYYTGSSVTSTAYYTETYANSGTSSRSYNVGISSGYYKYKSVSNSTYMTYSSQSGNSSGSATISIKIKESALVNDRGTNTGTKTYTFYVNVELRTITINFKPGEGTVSINSKVFYVNDDSPFTNHVTATRTGYTFSGWSSYTTAKKAYDGTKGTSVNVTAQWTANKYTVTFNAASGSIPSSSSWSGSGSSATKQVTYASTYGTIPTPTRTGYTFGGWFTGQNGAGSKIISSTKVSITSAQTLYAKWTAISYKVTFDKNGATGSMSDQSLEYDKEGNLTANGFTKTGYTFDGWKVTSGLNTGTAKWGTSSATSSVTTSTVLSNSAKVKNLTTKNGAIITLTAQWKAITYKIQFAGNGNTG
ncbi:MAG: InlB B-repeat-containing protein, partial [Clostridia bacterium]|nr:InlB B-repeat-containing protein [Clostridia bacterium]